METNILQIVLTIIAVGVIGGMKFYERKYGSNPEAWDIQKFGMLIMVAIGVMVLEYLYGNVITFPAEDIIVPAMALFGSAYTIITGGKLLKNAATAKTTAQPATGFVLPRDGGKIADGLDGWWIRLNPSPEAATLPDDKCYQAVSPKGNFHSGDKATIEYLVSSPDAAGWRSRNA